MLTLADALCSAYGWELKPALRMPLCQVLVLLRQRRHASGNDANTPGYEELAFAREAKTYLLELQAREENHG